jgi:hypothetical protein
MVLKSGDKKSQRIHVGFVRHQAMLLTHSQPGALAQGCHLFKSGVKWPGHALEARLLVFIARPHVTLYLHGRYACTTCAQLLGP